MARQVEGGCLGSPGQPVKEQTNICTEAMSHSSLSTISLSFSSNVYNMAIYMELFVCHANYYGLVVKSCDHSTENMFVEKYQSPVCHITMV